MAQLHFDGSCWVNPGGTAAFGYVLDFGSGHTVRGKGVIGTGPGMSNNLAEFRAVAEGLEEAGRLFLPCDSLGLTTGTVLNVYGDSNLVIKIMNGDWLPKSSKAYWPGYLQARNALKELYRVGVTVTFSWIPREENTKCDELSKAHLKSTPANVLFTSNDPRP